MLEDKDDEDKMLVEEFREATSMTSTITMSTVSSIQNLYLI